MSTLVEDDSSSGALKTPHKQSKGPRRYAYERATDQTAVHEERCGLSCPRCGTMSRQSRCFELVPSSCATKWSDRGTALRDRLRAASQAGAQILIIGCVHKMSALVRLAQIAAIDTTSQRVVFRKFFTFRGDNDEALQGAEAAAWATPKSAFAKAGLEFHPHFQTQSSLSVAEMVRAGLGVGFVTQLGAAQIMTSGVTLSF